MNPSTPSLPDLVAGILRPGIDRLRALTQTSIQAQWCISKDAAPPGWELGSAPLNPQGHIAWERGCQGCWLHQRIQVPETLAGFPVAGLALKLALTWWAEQAAIYVNGERVQTGDLFDCFTRVRLSDRVQPGDAFTLALHLISPSHDDGALVRSQLIYESLDWADPEPGFIADEIAVLTTYAERNAPDRLPALVAAIAPMDWAVVGDRAAFRRELHALRQRLLPFSPWIKQRQIHCLGHAHLDLAWLWPVAETWVAAERTFASVLALQKDYPELTYTHSSPALFAWLEHHKPALFQQVQQAVSAGRWGIDAGFWVEPELNTLGGESLARQILYGQRYCAEKFGSISPVAWLPDSFGFSWQLPQLMYQGGIRCFATQKLRWNDTTTFPHELFWWQGRDGTAILSLNLPPIGSDIDPEKMATHGADWERSTGLKDALWLPGVGDHGGGPTRDMLEKARRWSQSPLFPEVTFGLATDFLQRIVGKELSAGAASATPSPLPTWNDELYLELHRGCYTTHGDQKCYSRRCEEGLVQAEIFAAIAALTTGATYPQAVLETAWKQVLFNQFHDILPGTAIPEVFATANQTWAAAQSTAAKCLTEAVGAITRSLALPCPPHPDALPLLVFNGVAETQTQVIEVVPPTAAAGDKNWGIVDTLGRPVPMQESLGRKRLFLAEAVPSIGYRVFWWVPLPLPQESANAAVASLPNNWILENPFLQVEIDPATGDICRLWDKVVGRDVLNGAGNQLQAFRDAGQYWDAWNLAPDYADHPLPPSEQGAIAWIDQGCVRQRLRVTRRIADSHFQQDYVLDAHSPYLKIITEADWQASQVVLKVAFPLTVQAAAATYEIPFGAIARPIGSTDPHQGAKWEVPALRWADLSDDNYGVSILTDYKHGFDAQANQLRLTLLKAPLWPDPQADRGHHSFTYAIYPHRGNWQAGRTPHAAIAFNTPLIPLTLSARAATQAEAPEAHSFLTLGGETLGLAAFKISEDDPHAYILRCWEMYGQEATLGLETGWDTAAVTPVNLLETAIAPSSGEAIRPWQIASYRVQVSHAP